MHNKSIRGTSFTLPSVKKLKKQLGKTDAFTQYIEVAIRHLEKGYGDGGTSFNQYVKTVSEEVGVHLYNIDIKNYKQGIILRHLITPRAFLESFVEDLQDDIRGMGYPAFKADRKPPKGVSLQTELDKLVYNINNELLITVSLMGFQKDLFDYYRLLRNSVAHASIDSAKIEYAYKMLDLNAIRDFYPTLDAPNRIESLTFDDFTLCTANIKNIADMIVSSLECAMKWDSAEVTGHPCFSGVKQKAKVRTKERMFGYIRQCAMMTWHIAPSDTDCKKIFDSLV
ncbi:MAG: hypothetical protein Q4F85_15155 [Prevotella sp.]|nr:hypothetical protein [Prevotella sp.]